MGATTSIVPVADATLYQSADGSVANGAGESLFVGRNSGGITRRSLIVFDLASVIPAGSTITSATIRFSVSSTAGGPTPVALHRVTTAWTEGPSDPTESEGSGAPAESGDATWLHASYPSSLWATPGGDFDAAAFAWVTIDHSGLYEIFSSTSLIAQLQSWLDTPTANLGFEMVGDESAPGTAKRIDSRAIADESARPLLTIEFTVPAPAGAGLGAIYAATLVRRRRA